MKDETDRAAGLFHPSSFILHPSKRSRQRVARELEVRQPGVADLELVGPAVGRRRERLAARERHHVVLVDAVAADPEAADQTAAVEERLAAREEDDAALVPD